jgi:hypothetical protein
MTKPTLFFLNEYGLSGKIVTRKGPLMSLSQRAIAGVFAAAMAVSPSLAQNAGTVAAKPDPNSVSTPAGVAQEATKPNELRQAEKLSETYPGIVIAIAKGQKDQITGEKIGDTLSGVIKKVSSAPSKYVVWPGGDYTAVAFFVKGHAYGPYGLKESLTGLSLAADDYNEKIHNGTFPPVDSASSQEHGIPGGILAKPEPHQ